MMSFMARKQYDPKAVVTNEKLDGAIEHIVMLLEEMKGEMVTKKEYEEFRQEVNLRFDSLEQRVDKLPSRFEFERLKKQVEEVVLN